MAPVCRSFSRAVTPPVRSSRFPRGLPNLTMTMREKVSEVNQMAEFLEKVIEECERLLLAYWAENHDGSFLWVLKGWKRFKESDSPHVFRCSYFADLVIAGERIITRFANNTALQRIRMLCKCLRREHVRLRGYSRLHGMQWTEVAELYPRGLSRLLARATAVKARWLHKDKLNILGCCRSPASEWARLQTLALAGQRRPLGGVTLLKASPVASYHSP